MKGKGHGFCVFYSEHPAHTSPVEGFGFAVKGLLQIDDFLIDVFTDFDLRLLVAKSPRSRLGDDDCIALELGRTLKEAIDNCIYSV